MLGVKTGYWTWGALWIPRSTSVWSAICTEEPNTCSIDSLATQQTCYSLHFSLKVVLDRKSDAENSNRVDKIFMVKADVGPTNGEFPRGLCKPGEENNKWLVARFHLYQEDVLPAVPTLKRQNWWPRSQADLIRKACRSAGFSPPSEVFPEEQWDWNSLNWL